MTRAEILKKVFAKAKKNGYEIKLPSNIDGEISMDKVIEFGIYYKFIFNHDFAKAFFTQKFNGEKLVVKQDYYLDRLAEMAKHKNPIKYLEKYI